MALVVIGTIVPEFYYLVLITKHTVGTIPMNKLSVLAVDLTVSV